MNQVRESNPAIIPEMPPRVKDEDWRVEGRGIVVPNVIRPHFPDKKVGPYWSVDAEWLNARQGLRRFHQVNLPPEA
jgi:hypothetical protein